MLTAVTNRPGRDRVFRSDRRRVWRAARWRAGLTLFLRVQLAIEERGEIIVAGGLGLSQFDVGILQRRDAQLRGADVLEILHGVGPGGQAGLLERLKQVGALLRSLARGGFQLGQRRLLGARIVVGTKDADMLLVAQIGRQCLGEKVLEAG